MSYTKPTNVLEEKRKEVERRRQAKRQKIAESRRSQYEDISIPAEGKPPTQEESAPAVPSPTSPEKRQPRKPRINTVGQSKPEAVSAFVSATSSVPVNLVTVVTNKLNWEIHSIQGLLIGLIQDTLTHVIQNTKYNDNRTRDSIQHQSVFDSLGAALHAAIQIMNNASPFKESTIMPESFDTDFILAPTVAPSFLTNALNAFSPLENCFVINCYDTMYKLARTFNAVSELRVLTSQNNFQNFPAYKTIDGWSTFIKGQLVDTDVLYVPQNSTIIDHTSVFKHLSGFRIVQHNPQQFPRVRTTADMRTYPQYRLSVRARKFAFCRIDDQYIKSESQTPLLGGSMEKINAIFKYKYYDHYKIDRAHIHAVQAPGFEQIPSAEALVKAVNANNNASVSYVDRNGIQLVIQAIPFANIHLPSYNDLDQPSDIENEELTYGESQLEAVLQVLATNHFDQTRVQDGETLYHDPVRNDWANKRQLYCRVVSRMFPRNRNAPRGN